MSQFWHPSANQVAKRILLEGKVQGVGCRAQVMERVHDIGHMSGFVRNLSDGRVEICVKGDDTRIESLTEILRKGLASPVEIARVLVTDLDSKELEEIGINNGFTIRRNDH